MEKTVVTYIKTATGFGPSAGVTNATIKVIREAVGNRMKIQASGGIKTYTVAELLLDAGADLVGTSHAPEIVRDAGMAYASQNKAG